jgi:hypothetical protein
VPAANGLDRNGLVCKVYVAMLVLLDGALLPCCPCATGGMRVSVQGNAHAQAAGGHSEEGTALLVAAISGSVHGCMAALRRAVFDAAAGICDATNGSAKALGWLFQLDTGRPEVHMAQNL